MRKMILIDEATVKLALEGLEEIHPGNMTPIAEEAWKKAITAMRETLAEQPAPMIRGDIRDGLVDDEPAQQHIEHCLWARNGNQPCPHVQPAQRTWVGLTDDERLEVAEIDGSDEWFWKVCKAIEAKLREKNNG